MKIWSGCFFYGTPCSSSPSQSMARPLDLVGVFHLKNPRSYPLASSQLIDWLIEQGLTSPPTQYRLSGRQFYRSKDPTNSIKVLKEKLVSHRPEEAPNPPGASHRVTSEPLKKEKPYHSGLGLGLGLGNVTGPLNGWHLHACVMEALPLEQAKWPSS